MKGRSSSRCVLLAFLCTVGPLTSAGQSAASPSIGSNDTNGSVYSARAFAGADPSAQINACVRAARANADAENGQPTTCDARTFSGQYEMREQITVLSKTVLLLPHYATWLWNLTDGVSAGILQQGSSIIVGAAPGGGGNHMILSTSSNRTNMLALYATDVMPPEGGSYIYASGFNAQNLDLGKDHSFAGARFAHGLVYTRHTFDEARFERIMAENDFGDSWHIANTCCDTEFVQVQATSSYVHGGTPLTVEDGAEYMTVDKAAHEVSATKQAAGAFPLGPASFSWSGTVNAAGPGHPNILIRPHNAEISFPHLYVEAIYRGVSDNTAPVIENAGVTTPLEFGSGGMQCGPNKPLFSHPNQVGIALGEWGGLARTYSSNGRFGRVGLSDANTRAINAGEFASMYGALGAGNTQFKPRTTGWYQIYGGFPGLRGMFDIQVGYATNLTGTVVQNYYGGPSTITVLDPGFQQGQGNNPIDAIATWSPGGLQEAALAVHVANLPNDGEPISINFLGQGFDSRGIRKPAAPMAKPPSRTDPSYSEWKLPSSAMGAVGFSSSGAVAGSTFIGGLSTPRSSTSPCYPGQSWDDANFHYVCVAANKIKRVALSDF